MGLGLGLREARTSARSIWSRHGREGPGPRAGTPISVMDAGLSVAVLLGPIATMLGRGEEEATEERPDREKERGEKKKENEKECKR